MRRSSQGMTSLSYGAAGSGRGLLACYVKAKPRPSKWDDAQRWLSSSRANDDDRRRSSCADDRLLLPSASEKGRHSWSATDGAALPAPLGLASRDDGDAEAEAETETKRVDSVLAYGQPPRSLLLRDIGTEMTPVGSKEPSRANTPRATLPATPAPAAPSAAGRAIRARRRRPDSSTDAGSPPAGLVAADRGAGSECADAQERKEAAQNGAPPPTAVSPATAWDAAERAKHMARYRREEMKIQAWENRRRRKAELQMKMTEAKAERMKLRAQEKTASKLASAQAEAREKRAQAEAKLNRRAARVGGRADVLRRASSVFSLKLPLMCR